jgi:MFS family permease
VDRWPTTPAAIGLTTAVWQVAVLRAFAWISRGIRSPSRDMLLTSLVTKKTYGRAFGIERAGDNAGAILGPVLASLLVGLVGLRSAILLSIVPGVLAAISITLAAREARRAIGERPVRRTLHLQLRRLRRGGLGRVLIPIACFELGNVATTLLILRATGLLTSGGRDLAAATSWRSCFMRAITQWPPRRRRSPATCATAAHHGWCLVWAPSRTRLVTPFCRGPAGLAAAAGRVSARWSRDRLR